MGRILVVVLGLAVVLGAAYYYLNGQRGRTVEDVDAQVRPSQQLENVRQAAKRIEEDSQRRADELLKKSE